MTPTAQRIAIAEACGWRFTERAVFTPQGGEVNRDYAMAPRNTGACCVPDYSTLDAMREAEKTLKPSQYVGYLGRLAYVVGVTKDDSVGGDFRFVTATAAQRAEAFLRTLGKWDDKL